MCSTGHRAHVSCNQRWLQTNYRVIVAYILHARDIVVHTAYRRRSDYHITFHFHSFASCVWFIRWIHENRIIRNVLVTYFQPYTLEYTVLNSIFHSFSGFSDDMPFRLDALDVLISATYRLFSLHCAIPFSLPRPLRVFMFLSLHGLNLPADTGILNKSFF